MPHAHYFVFSQFVHPSAIMCVKAWTPLLHRWCMWMQIRKCLYDIHFQTSVHPSGLIFKNRHQGTEVKFLIQVHRVEMVGKALEPRVLDLCEVYWVTCPWFHNCCFSVASDLVSWNFLPRPFLSYGFQVPTKSGKNFNKRECWSFF